MPSGWMTSADAGRRLNLTPDAVRAIERSGRLKAVRTEGGVRLFRAEDVERLRLARERELEGRAKARPRGDE